MKRRNVRKNLQHIGKVCVIRSTGVPKANEVILVTKLRTRRKGENRTRFEYVEQALFVKSWKRAIVIFDDDELPVSAKVAFPMWFKARGMLIKANVCGKSVMLSEVKG